MVDKRPGGGGWPITWCIKKIILDARLTDNGVLQWWRAEALWQTSRPGLGSRKNVKINRKTCTCTRVWYDWNSKNRPLSVLIALIGNVLITYMIYCISSTWNVAARRRLTCHTPRTLLISTAEFDVRFYGFTRHESEFKGIDRRYFCFVLFYFILVTQVARSRHFNKWKK